MSEIQKIRSLDDLNRILTDSDLVPVWIFKHSLACGVSSHALKEFRDFVEDLDPDDPAHFALVEIQQVPEISREVTQRSGVRHQSPQLILWHNGAVAWEGSHWAIEKRALAEVRASQLGSRGVSDVEGDQ